MIRKIQIVIMLWLLMLIPFYIGLKYIDWSSTDSVNACLETFLTTENNNVAVNVSEKINASNELYKLYITSLDLSKVKDSAYMGEALKRIPCDQENVIRLKIADENGNLLYSSDRYDTGDFLYDNVSKLAEKGYTNIELVSLDKDSKSIGISFFFSIVSKHDNKRYYIQILNPFSYIDKYISKIDEGIFPRFFYIISPEFMRYVSMSGIFVDDKEKNLAMSLGCHLTKALKKTTTDGNKMFVVDKRMFLINIKELSLAKDIKGPKLFAIVAAHDGSVAILSDELLGGLPLSLTFVLMFTALVSLIISRRYLKTDAKLRVASGISEATPIPIIVFELETGKVLETNEPASVLLRSSIEKILNINGWTLFNKKEDAEYVKNAILSDIPVQNYEVVVNCATGSYFWAMISVNPISIDDKLYIIVGIYDISHRREMELKLEHNTKTLEAQVLERTKAIEEQASKIEASNLKLENAIKDVERANEAKGKFLAHMSNELKMPLDAIIGRCEVLVEEAEIRKDLVSASDLRRIISTANNLLTMVGELSNLSKIESGAVTINNETFDIYEFIEEINMSIRPLFIDSAATLIVSCPQNMGMMRCDKAKLRQCITNLISNAAKYTTNGEVLLKVLDDFVGNENYIQFIIRDTGCGIEAEQLARIKQYFANEYKADDNSIGLGISIVNQYCQMIKGTVLVDSDYGTGTEFIINVPRIGEKIESDDDNDPKNMDKLDDIELGGKGKFTSMIFE